MTEPTGATATLSAYGPVNVNGDTIAATMGGFNATVA